MWTTHLPLVVQFTLEPEMICSFRWSIFLCGDGRVANYVSQFSPNGFFSALLGVSVVTTTYLSHDDVIKWKHFPRNWPFVRGIHRSPVNSPHKGQWRGALMFCLICVWINDWVNNREAGDLRRYRAHYDVIVMRHMNCDSHYSDVIMNAVASQITSLTSVNSTIYKSADQKTSELRVTGFVRRIHRWHTSNNINTPIHSMYICSLYIACIFITSTLPIHKFSF